MTSIKLAASAVVSALAISALLIACAPAADDSGVAESAVKASSAPLKEVGVYHLLGAGDATNLDIRPDGTFVWSINGCDFRGGDCGTWRARLEPGGGIILSSSRGAFSWNANGLVTDVPTLVAVRDGDGDTMSIAGTGPEGEFSQTWRTGTVCAQCGGGLGPSGSVACTEPVTADCR